MTSISIRTLCGNYGRMFFGRILVLWFLSAFIGFAWDLIIPITASAQSSSLRSLTDSVISKRGAELKGELEATYQDLKSRKALTNDNDVTAIVIKYIPIGTTFDDAEAILRAAGCLVGNPSQHQDVPTRPYAERMRLSTVDGSLPMNHGILDIGRKFVVQLFPQTPTDYTIVDRVEASIIKQYL